MPTNNVSDSASTSAIPFYEYEYSTFPDDQDNSTYYYEDNSDPSITYYWGNIMGYTFCLVGITLYLVSLVFRACNVNKCILVFSFLICLTYILLGIAGIVTGKPQLSPDSNDFSFSIALILSGALLSILVLLYEKAERNMRRRREMGGMLPPTSPGSYNVPSDNTSYVSSEAPPPNYEEGEYAPPSYEEAIRRIEAAKGED